MNFTREPIIETIISPRDGFKLLVRSSKGGGSEEYFVDALEVVSFGHAFFFRSLERPKSFLAPVTDYEVLEVKETRVALKNVSHERSIKIGGGREAPPRQHLREAPMERESEAIEAGASEEGSSVETSQESQGRMEKRRDRHRRRRRRSSDEQEWQERKPVESSQEPETAHQAAGGEGGGASEETKVSSSMFTHLLPPPPTLISETISRYKGKEFSIGTQKQAEEVVPEEKPKKDDDEPKDSHDSSESAPLHRVATEPLEAPSTQFGSTGFDPFP